MWFGSCRDRPKRNIWGLTTRFQIAVNQRVRRVRFRVPLGRGGRIRNVLSISRELHKVPGRLRRPTNICTTNGQQAGCPASPWPRATEALVMRELVAVLPRQVKPWPRGHIAALHAEHAEHRLVMLTARLHPNTRLVPDPVPERTHVVGPLASDNVVARLHVHHLCEVVEEGQQTFLNARHIPITEMEREGEISTLR